MNPALQRAQEALETLPIDSIDAEGATPESNPGVEQGVPKSFRRLKWNELVQVGDFVVHQLRGFELWEGPSGFRADSFVKPIYRRDRRRPC